MKNSNVSEDFIAYVAHELRSPITIIRGFAEVLQDHPELVQDISGKILHTSLRLEKIVKGLLMLADTEFVPEQIDLSALLKRVLMLYPNAQISVQSEEAVISGNADLLELAVGNLLENAIKYSSGAAKVCVHVFREGANINIAVQDEGIGIPKEHLAHIFDRFYAVNKALSRKLGGAGLGLSLVNSIIKKHGGSISVASEYGKGSIFTLSLPLTKQSICSIH
jgi:signal transduction histidine kinase